MVTRVKYMAIEIDTFYMSWLKSFSFSEKKDSNVVRLCSDCYDSPHRWTTTQPESTDTG